MDLIGGGEKGIVLAVGVRLKDGGGKPLAKKIEEDRGK